MWRKNSWVKAYILLCALCKARVKLKTCGLNLACAGHFVWPLGALKVFNCLIIESMLRSFLTWSIIFLITVKMSLTHWCNDTIADTVPLCLYSWTVNDVSLQVSSTWTWNVSVSLWICVCVCVNTVVFSSTIFSLLLRTSCCLSLPWQNSARCFPTVVRSSFSQTRCCQTKWSWLHYQISAEWNVLFYQVCLWQLSPRHPHTCKGRYMTLCTARWEPEHYWLHAGYKRSVKPSVIKTPSHCFAVSLERKPETSALTPGTRSDGNVRRVRFNDTVKQSHFLETPAATCTTFKAKPETSKVHQEPLHTSIIWKICAENYILIKCPHPKVD